MIKIILITFFFCSLLFAHTSEKKQLQIEDTIYDLADLSFSKSDSSVIGMSRKWDNGILPVVFDKKITPREKYLFLKACESWQEIANIKCTKGEPTKKHLLVQSTSSGCYAALGSGTSSMLIRVLNLEKLGCWSQRTIKHEIGHALGFFHEHQRSDRNKYIKIIAKNIKLTSVQNFFKIFWVPTQGEYDFESIMHYQKNTFAKKRNLVSIMPRRDYVHFLDIMGIKDKLSAGDILKAIQLYGPPRESYSE